MTASFQSLALCKMLARLIRGTSWESKNGEKERVLMCEPSFLVVLTVNNAVSFSCMTE